jgi:zinc transporter ZupT
MLRAVLATGAAILGGLIVLVFGEVRHRVLCALVSFAAGALLSVAALNILPEAAELSNWPIVIVSAFIGLGIFYLIGKYVYFLCPACAASAINEDRGYLRLGILMILAMTLHSLSDGLALALGSEANVPLVGLLILIAITYHKIPEGLALTSVSLMAGFKRWRALLVTILVETTTALGAFLGLIISKNISGSWVGILLGHVAGGFLYIVFFALIQEMREHEKRSIVTYSILGFLSIVILRSLLSGIVH